MHRLILIATRGAMEILGLLEPSSPNPRRNTSNDFFEVLRGGDKVDTCPLFVSTLSPLFVQFAAKVDTKGRQSGHTSIPSNDLSTINC